jgi:hypothetical protein
MSDTSAGAQAPQPSGLAGRQILDAVKDNFVVVSGVAALIHVPVNGFALSW